MLYCKIGQIFAKMPAQSDHIFWLRQKVKSQNIAADLVAGKHKTLSIAMYNMYVCMYKCKHYMCVRSMRVYNSISIICVYVTWATLCSDNGFSSAWKTKWHHCVYKRKIQKSCKTLETHTHNTEANTIRSVETPLHTVDQWHSRSVG